ncbi:MAG: peptidase M61 [Cytophagales bacterium]|nr:MAG: peptidase M61 [Cytophagales bacterium]TAF60173.1 MAG: peptidase M61 [Cytophagales bacterium]
MLKRIFTTTVSCLAFVFAVYAQDPNFVYRFSLNLTEVKNDRLMVSLQVQNFKQNEISYFMAKIVPGTYSVYDFGRFASDFKALDKDGNSLPVKQVNDNEWRISEATKLATITYWVEDTYDTDKGNVVFEPAGTSFESDRLFIMNTHGIFGYFDGMKQNRFEVSIKKPQGFYGSTALVPTQTDAQRDVYQTASFNELVDSPMMYNLPDTATVKIGGADVLISVYSFGKKNLAGEISKQIKTTLEAQMSYMGGKLPVKKYAFIVYLFAGTLRSGSYGALEHSYSSFYCLPNMPPKELTQTVIDIAAHEFFHIITPLTLHSEEIHYFDFNNPKMSKHLWLYEGTVEFFAGHMQLYEGLMNLPAYLETMRGKMQNARFQYKDNISFTELSSLCLGKHKSQYGNVYEKGALISMCLDIKLRQLSDGKRGLMDVIQELSAMYGSERPFKDEELFDKLVSITYPEIRVFIDKHIEGNEPLPFKEVFDAIGIDYADQFVEKDVLGGVMLEPNDENDKVVVSSTWKLNEMGLEMGYIRDDVVLSINKKPITPQNLQEVLQQLKNTLKDNDKVSVTVLRPSSDQKTKKIKLKGKVKTGELKTTFYMMPQPNASAQQLKIRQAWMRRAK